MDFFNEIMKFGDIFESQETIDELKDISDEIKKYDVYDVLARISGLNLMPHNQNKSVLLDSLIAGIICEEENTYDSTYKMSSGKFKKLIGKINETREPPKMEKVIDGHTGFLFYYDDGNPLVAMHWQHRFNRMVGRYNDIYRVQMPNITPHVCRHTYCSNMAKSGMNPKTLQYLMGHSDISVTMNVYTHISFDDAEEELKRMEEFRKAQAEIEKKNDAKAVSQKMFKVV